VFHADHLYNVSSRTVAHITTSLIIA